MPAGERAARAQSVHGALEHDFSTGRAGARPKVHDEVLRDRLRARAAELLSAHGVTGLSLRTLAADVGTSTTAVYALFGGKPGLVKSLVDDAFRRRIVDSARQAAERLARE